MITISKKTQWSITLFVILIGLYAFAMAFALHSDIKNPIIEKLALSPFSTLTHFIGGGIAIFIGLFQFNTHFRHKHSNLHKLLGSLYFAALFSSGIAGIYMGVHAHGGIVAQAGFTLLSTLWIFTAMMALWSIMKGNIPRHKFWIYLNYSLTLAAVTLRLQMPFGFALFEFDTFYPIVAWSCWVPNLYIAYRIVRS